MKNLLLLIISIAFISCDPTIVRDEDLPSLKQEAADGNHRAISAIVGWGSYTGLSEDTLKAYEEILLEHGNEYALDRQTNGLHPDWYRDEKREKEERELFKWLTFGAEHGCPEYMVRLGEYYLNPAHPDQELATYWYQRAADSLNYNARMAFIKWNDSEMLLDRASKGFAEQWKMKSKDYTIIGKISTSVVRFATGFAIGSFSVLFSSETWWQGFIGIAVMILGLVLLVLIYVMSRKYTREASSISSLPILFSCFYGVINGFASWFGHAYSIGRFVRVAGMYSSVSDWCIYGSWIWLVGFLLTLAYGAYKVQESGSNTIIYILLMIGSSFFCYIASMMITVVFIVLFAFVLAIQLFIATASDKSPAPKHYTDRDAYCDRCSYYNGFSHTCSRTGEDLSGSNYRACPWFIGEE